MAHWIFWAGISFVLVGLVSIGVILGGEGRSSSLVDEIFNYSIGWAIIGIGLTIFGLTTNIIKTEVENRCFLLNLKSNYKKYNEMAF